VCRGSKSLGNTDLLYRSKICNLGHGKIILQFGAGRTMIKIVVLFYFIFNIILNKNGFLCVGYKLKKALDKIIF
jgi:hypothetical protein